MVSTMTVNTCPWILLQNSQRGGSCCLETLGSAFFNIGRDLVKNAV